MANKSPPKRRPAPKRKVMYAVMVNDEMYPDSLSEKRVWAAASLGDARHAALAGARVRVARVVIEEL